MRVLERIGGEAGNMIVTFGDFSIWACLWFLNPDIGFRAKINNQENGFVFIILEDCKTIRKQGSDSNWVNQLDGEKLGALQQI